MSHTRLHTTRIACFIALAAIIIYFLPRTAENTYSFEVNRPWSYTLLTAPYDIPVHLDSVSARHLRDSIDRTFEPVYQRHTDIEKDVITQCATRLANTPGLGINQAGRNAITNALRQIYNDGIVDRDTYAKIETGQLKAVRFIADNIATTHPTHHLRSIRKAYTHLDTLLTDPALHSAISNIKLADILQPNIILDTLTSQRLYDEAIQKAMAPIGVIQQGERIIDRGDIVTPRLATVLATYAKMAQQRTGTTVNQHYYPILGQTLYVAIVLTMLYIYLFYFRRDYLTDLRTTLFILTMTGAFTLLTFAMHAGFARAGIYLSPLTILPIMLLIFLDSRTAYFCHMALVMLCALVAAFPLEFIFLQLIAGIVAITSLKDLSRRSQLIRTALLVFVAYGISATAIEIIHSGTIDKMPTRMFGYLGINAVLISFSYIMMFIFERIFGFTSRVTLVELSDINNPLLRELSEECPGTFQHSMAVSNLSSAAASRIGANVQLIRAGALYHDIGKIKNPAFFTENQHGVNPHDALDPIRSAHIVTGHVTDGLNMAEHAKLPPVIKDFITQHHGRGVARYFYNTYANSHPDTQIDDKPFRYPGPNPQSRETSILMMADAVEAASRSMQSHTPEAITTLVNKIIDTQIAEGLHNESPLSFRDVTAIKDEFARRLRTMYHSRISYPDLKKQSPTTEASCPPAQ